jgi:hypothetical protein
MVQKRTRGTYSPETRSRHAGRRGGSMHEEGTRGTVNPEGWAADNAMGMLLDEIGVPKGGS